MVARSSAEIIYRVLIHGVCELLRLKNLIEELKMISHNHVPLFYGNKVVINIVHHTVQHDKTKHVKIDGHFIKEKNDETICIPFVNFENQLINMFTKDLKIRMFHLIFCKMGITYIPAPSSNGVLSGYLCNCLYTLYV